MTNEAQRNEDTVEPLVRIRQILKAVVDYSDHHYEVPFTKETLADWAKEGIAILDANAPDQARLQPSPEAGCSASVVSKGPGGYSPCGGCSPESTSDYAACDGCQFNPDKPNAAVEARRNAVASDGRLAGG